MTQSCPRLARSQLRSPNESEDRFSLVDVSHCFGVIPRQSSAGSSASVLVSVVKDRRVAAYECFAVQIHLVLIGPQHGSRFAPKQ